jgi:hypothetical protein
MRLSLLAVHRVDLFQITGTKVISLAHVFVVRVAFLQLTVHNEMMVNFLGLIRRTFVVIEVSSELTNDSIVRCPFLENAVDE